MSELIRTACGGKLIVTQKSLEHLRAHPEVHEVLPEAASKLTLPSGSFVEAEIELGRVVGVTSLVALPAIGATDPALFALRQGRPMPSRVVPADTPRVPTSKVMIVAKPADRGEYLLVTAFLGEKPEKEPWDRNLRNDAQRLAALAFWCRHALIHDPNTMNDPFESSWARILQTGDC